MQIIVNYEKNIEPRRLNHDDKFDVWIAPMRQCTNCRVISWKVVKKISGRASYNYRSISTSLSTYLAVSFFKMVIFVSKYFLRRYFLIGLIGHIFKNLTLKNIRVKHDRPETKDGSKKLPHREQLEKKKFINLSNNLAITMSSSLNFDPSNQTKRRKKRSFIKTS